MTITLDIAKRQLTQVGNAISELATAETALREASGKLGETTSFGTKSAVSDTLRTAYTSLIHGRDAVRDTTPEAQVINNRLGQHLVRIGTIAGLHDGVAGAESVADVLANGLPRPDKTFTGISDAAKAAVGVLEEAAKDEGAYTLQDRLGMTRSLAFLDEVVDTVPTIRNPHRNEVGQAQVLAKLATSSDIGREAARTASGTEKLVGQLAESNFNLLRASGMYQVAEDAVVGVETRPSGAAELTSFADHAKKLVDYLEAKKTQLDEGIKQGHFTNPEE